MAKYRIMGKKGAFLLVAVCLLYLLGELSVPRAAASETNGTIDTNNRYAWSENVGWIDFGTSHGSIRINASGLYGYAWGENIGWISLNCENTNSCGNVNYAVSNTDSGVLSGYAWGENVGWIQFNPTGGGVFINELGEFKGYAWGENIGWITFNCASTSTCSGVSYKVATDWRPISGRGEVKAPQSSGIGTIASPTPPKEKPPQITPPKIPPKELTKEQEKELPRPAKMKKPDEPPMRETGKSTIIKRPKYYKKHLAKPKPKQKTTIIVHKPSAPNTVRPLPITPLVRIPPALTQPPQPPPPTHNPTLNITPPPPQLLQRGQKFPTLKENIPANIVFASSGKDLNRIALPIQEYQTADGELEQRIQGVVGSPLRLSVKPDKDAADVRAYLTFRSVDPSFFAASTLGIDEALILKTVAYTDADGDSVYSADLPPIQTKGEYEIITVINYKEDEEKKVLRLITVMEAAGYIFEKRGPKEVRIPDATVSLHWKNPDTNEFELWPAEKYTQKNPQITDLTGEYAFIVHGGSYYLTAEAEGYSSYKSDLLEVREGSRINANIQLSMSSAPARSLKWQIFIGLVVTALILNMWRSRYSDKATK